MGLSRRPTTTRSRVMVENMLARDAERRHRRLHGKRMPEWDRE